MSFEDRTAEWANHIDTSCRNLGLSIVSGPSLNPPTPLSFCPPPYFAGLLQEDTRHHKQQLLLKPTRDRSQFSTVAENVVSTAATQFALGNSTQQGAASMPHVMHADCDMYKQHMDLQLASMAYHLLLSRLYGNTLTEHVAGCYCRETRSVSCGSSSPPTSGTTSPQVNAAHAQSNLPCVIRTTQLEAS